MEYIKDLEDLELNKVYSTFGSLFMPIKIMEYKCIAILINTIDKVIIRKVEFDSLDMDKYISLIPQSSNEWPIHLKGKSAMTEPTEKEIRDVFRYLFSASPEIHI